MAIGVAVSVLVHTIMAWTIAQYISSGEDRQLELRARGLAAEAPELIGTFADPANGRVGGTIETSNGEADRAGEPTGEIGPDPEGAEESEAPARDETDPTEESSPEEDPESSQEPEPERAAAAGRTEQPSPPDSNDAPDAVEPDPEASDEGGGETTAQKSEGAEAVDEGRPGTKPSFPSIEGDGAGAAGDEGSGEGAGTRGGVSIALFEEVLRAHRDEIRECYARHHDYISEGKKVVVVEFWVGTDGTVPRTRTVHRTTNLRVADCMKERIAELQFPEVDETVSFVKQFSIDARIEADWVHPRLPEE